MSLLARKAADKLFRKLDHLEQGRFEVTTPDGKTRVFEGKTKGRAANINMRDWGVLTRAATKGDIGIAETYKDGLWDTDNLTDFLTFCSENSQSFEQYVLGRPMMRLIANIGYMFRPNTQNGSKKNIHAHYDIGNDFYQLWLDPTMTYSSALYHTGQESLVDAQHNKYDRIIDQMDGHCGRVLEVGCGWGGFADRAVEKADIDLKAITISNEQFDYARNRLGGRAQIALEDYRNQSGKYNNIVSIEMFEAVGEQFWKTYFEKMKSLLDEKGKAVIQTIMIRDQDFDRYRKGSDFIRSYIFPGGMLPSFERFGQEAQNAGLRVCDHHAFGADYGRTLQEWMNRFDAKEKEMRALGFDESFMRLWRFYLAYCIAGFRSGRTDVMQVSLRHA